MLTPIFILSGTVLAIMLLAKRIEEKRKRNVFILNLISRGDTHVRELHHRAVRYYSIGKEKGVFLVKKQLPRYSRSSLNKALALIEERLQRHLDSIRDSRLLKKDEGISEFFKNISEVEKGGGELHDDVYDAESQEVIAAPQGAKEPVIEVRFEVVNTADTQPTKTVRPRARKSPAKRRLKVSSSEPEQFI